jgi:aquaporin Z
MKTVLPLLSEYLGTFLLVFVAMLTSNPFIIGITVILIKLLVGKYSGALLNPAVSYATYLQSKLSLREFLSFIAIQMIAALSSYGVYTIVA